MKPRLLSLELHGYKTFASRSAFEFPGMITAVVGPNGSGKSNIADSIRWVLGEQSYSLLRGKKTEDMIYSGSDQRPRAGMASATITFDNSDGWLPVDFSEISISRRAYRDGENEYLLNGQKVRLKDISELLANSGLSERTYTIIGQGLVDMALSLKPEERRRLFEEAAGIGLYRSRRDEAVNRLDVTHRNWDRVQDIIAELEPRLASLERQAKKALEYERIKADLQLLLRDWYGYHWHITQQELAHVIEVVKAQESKYQQARQRVDEASGEVLKFRQNLQGIRTQLNTWHQESSDLHNSRQNISRDIAIFDERLRSLAQQRQNHEKDILRLEQDVQVQQIRLDEITQSCELNEKQLEEARGQLASARKLVDSRAEERAVIENELQVSRQNLSNIHIRQAQIESEITQLNAQFERQSNELNDARNDHQRSSNEIQRQNDALSEFDSQIKEFEKNRNQLDAALQKVRTEGKNLEEAHKQARGEKYSLEAEEARVETQLSVLDEAERSLSGYGNGARYLLNLARDGQLKGVRYALSSQLDVPAELETAISAVLGEYLDMILIANKSELEEALQHLEAESSSGRAVMLSQDSVRKPTILPEVKDEHCLGVASKLINFPAELKPVVDLLLGQTYVIRHRSFAPQLMSTLPDNSRIVTLQGEIFTSDGCVIAGKDVKAGAIGRNRVLKELKSSQNTIAQKVKKVEQEIERVEIDMETNAEDLGKLEEDYRNILKQKEKADGDYQRTLIQVQQLSRQNEWQQKRIGDLEKELLRNRSEVERLNAEKEKIGLEVENEKNVVHEKSRSLAGFSLEELTDQMQHWDREVAVTERGLSDSRLMIQERENNLQQTAKQIDDTKERLAACQSLISQIEVETQSRQQEEAQFNSKIDALQKQIEPLETELIGMEEKYAELQETETSIQQAYTVADRHLSQAQMDLTRKREALDSLRRRIEEDFGLVAFEYAPEIPGQTTLPFEGMVEQLPQISELPTDLEESISRQKAQLRRLGAINPEAQKEYEEVSERYHFLKSQVQDLVEAEANLKQIIAELDELMKKEFRKTFDGVAEHFHSMFTRLFGGGSARLVMTDPENPADSGIDIHAKLPGKREQGLSLLSGGERSLTAAALIFALLKYSPTPFCVMDEVDAMLDEANVGRFRDLLLELSANTQFIVITHNRNTVQCADVIYGITMGRDTASQVISLKLDEVGEEMVK